MGTTTAGRIQPYSIIGTDISGTADIAAEAMRHSFVAGTNFATAIGGTPATREEIVYTASGAGVIKGVHALLNDTGTSTSVTVDAKKNGTTVLSSVITITDSDADRETVDGVLSVTSFVAGDVLSLALTVTTSTGAQGPFAFITLQETASPV